jgi:hypothetical protein
MADKSLTELIRIYFKAYETKDRSALESTTKTIHIRKLFDQANEAFVLYDLEPDNGQPFRNTEFFTGGGGKIKTIEVYFGSKIGRVEDIK